VDAHGDGAGAQALQGQGVVDFGGVRIVDGKRLHVGQRQLVGDGRCLQVGEARAFGEPVKQKALPVEVPGRVDGARVLQQRQRGFLAGLAGLDHGLVFGRVLVGPEEDLVELFAHRLRASACHQLLRPGFDLGLDLLFLFDRGQGLLHDFGGGLAETPFACATEVMRRFKQAHKGGGLLDWGGVGRKIVGGEVGKAELFFRGEFPGQVEFDGLGQFARFAQQGCRGRFVKLEQHLCGLDLDPLARVQLDLRRGLGFGHDPPGHELAGFFE